MTTQSRVLAWRIPGMGEPGGLPFMGSHRVGHDWSDAAAAVNASFQDLGRHIYQSLQKAITFKNLFISEEKCIFLVWWSASRSQVYPMENTGRSLLMGNFCLIIFISLSPLLGSSCKKCACNAGDTGSIPGPGRSTGEGIGYPLQYSWASLVAQIVKNLPAMWETWARSLVWENPLEEGMATHSSILSWRIPTDREAWRATFHGIAESWTWLRD